LYQETKGEIAVNDLYGEDFNSIRHSAAVEFTLNEPLAKVTVMPECFYRASMISIRYKLDSRLKPFRE